ncbi:MAG TPA: ABC transporter permease [Candidatus Acidoferrales bacterium]|nr:ABC transporter permease [Candidatus Acidoferrales bacterium]
MAIPVIYNLRSVRVRWTSSVVAVVGIAGTVGVFVAILAIAIGFRSTLVSSGSPSNALILRAGSNTEMVGAVSLDQVHIIEGEPGIVRDAKGPVVSPEVVVIAPFPLISTGTDANVQVRGVSARALDVRDSVHVLPGGRFFTPGLDELVVGKNAVRTYAGLNLGSTVQMAGINWKVVGIFDAGGSSFDSEVWCDATLLDQAYNRAPNVFQSVTVRLPSASDFPKFKDSLTSDPQLTVSVDREIDYYSKQSQGLTDFIVVIGTGIALVMGVGAIVGALNTMYSAVSERSREIATMRALGFGAGSVVISFMIESLLIAAIGGVVGCLAVLPLNGLTTSTLNFQTFSSIAFAFRVTPVLLAGGMIFALLMGLVGGTPPAFRAARRPITSALRGL